MFREQIELQARLTELAKKLLQEKVDIFLKDKSNSLEDRWEVWTKYSQTNSGDWIHRFPEEFKSWEEYFYDGRNKYETITYSRVIESYDDFFYDSELSEEEINSKVDSMKEYLMEQNLRSYKYDW